MKKQIIITSLFFLLACGQLFAQFTFSPSNPLPGTLITFSYIPPAGVFSQSDTIMCTAFKWGTYEDDIVFESGASYKAVEIKLKKNGPGYEGKILTDSLTKALTFNFTTRNALFNRVGNSIKLTAGKVDTNDSLGYCIPLFTQDGKESRYSNYFLGLYLWTHSLNKMGFSNTSKATTCYLRELELYPDQLGLVWPYLSPVMNDADPEGLKQLATRELNIITDRGLLAESDYRLASSLSYSLKLQGVSKYFREQAVERFKESGGIINLNELYSKFYNEQDISKKEILADKIIAIFNSFNYDDKSLFAFSALLPRYVKGYVLLLLLQQDNLDGFLKYRQKYNLTKETAPYLDHIFIMELETLLAQNKYPEFTEKEALGMITFYKARFEMLSQGRSLPAIADEEYKTPAMQKQEALSTLVQLSAFCAKLYQKAGDDQKAFGYAKDALTYRKINTNETGGEPEINTLYSLLAEKVLPQEQCKTEVEGMVAAGKSKPEMIELLKRIYIKEHSSEKGFEEYIASLRKSQIEELKKSIASTILNEPAPTFVLNDLDGKPVSLESLKGKVVILDFWATWCGPCKASFPAMKKLQEYYQTANPDVKILFVNCFEKSSTEQERAKSVKEYLTANGYPFHVVIDTKDKVASEFKVGSIPTKCIIDKNGNLRYRISGAETNEVKLLDEMNAMIESVK